MRPKNIFRLGIKELRVMVQDPIMLLFIVFGFTVAVYTAGTAVPETLNEAAIGIVDQDNSPLSRRIADAFYPPYFEEPRMIEYDTMDRGLDEGRYTFALHIPPEFQKDVLAGRQPGLQLNVDATRIGQAFMGSSYVQSIITEEVRGFLEEKKDNQPPPVNLALRMRFNPNLDEAWFRSVMELVNNIVMLSIILTGAALVREHERGTMEHLLVMPVTPAEIITSKIWSMSLIVLVATGYSLFVVVQSMLAVPVKGSMVVFFLGVVVMLFATTSMGIFLGNISKSMPQFALLVILLLMPLQMLSGADTPRESMPDLLRWITLLSPSTHFVAYCKAVLFRGAGLSIVWPQLTSLAAIGFGLYGIAIRRFRKTS